MRRKRRRANTWPTLATRLYHDWHYTPVVKVGDMVIVSGIPAAGDGAYEEKFRRMFIVLGKQLADAGAT